MDSTAKYLALVANYPARFGALSGIFFNLIEELEQTKGMSPERIEYYKNLKKSLDKHSALGYDGCKLTNGNKEETTKEGGSNL